MNNADFEKKKILNDNIVLDEFIICQKLWHKSNLKNTLLIDPETNPPKRPQSAAIDVEGVEYCWLHLG